MPEKRKPLKIFHINMLREWHAPTALSCWAEEICDEEPGSDDIITWSDPVSDDSPAVGEDLSSQQHSDIRRLWETFATVLNENPGRTNIREHHISTGEAHPIRLPPYRIPHAYRNIVKLGSSSAPPVNGLRLLSSSTKRMVQLDHA